MMRREREQDRARPFVGRIREELRGISRLVSLLLCLGFAGPALAMVHTVDPGEIPKLDSGEGLLLVEVDSNFDLDSVRVKKDGALFTAGVLRGIKAGQSARLYVVPAGRYVWYQVTTSWGAAYTMTNKTEYRFDVVPGKITYSGDLIFRPTSAFTANLLVSNRGLRAMDWLEAQHPQLARTYDFVYAGHYPDPFPTFYRKERQSVTASVVDLSAVAEPPKPGAMPLAIRDLWRAAYISDISLNPAGDLVVEAICIKEGKRWGLDLIDLKTRKVQRLAESDEPFVSLEWSGNRQLLGGVGERVGRQVVTLFRIGDDAERTVVTQRIPVPGHVLATNYGYPNEVLFQSYRDDGRLVVSHLRLSDRESIKSFRPQIRDRLNVGVENDLTWFADGSGNLRAAVARHGDRVVLMHGEDGHFTEVLDLGEDSGFQPQALSGDGELIYGVTDDGRGQRDLVEFDPAQRKVTRTLFSKPGVDMEAPALDDHGRAIGAVHYEGGRLVTEYFDADRQHLADLLARTFPGKSAWIGARSSDGNHLMLWVEGSDQPAVLYALDATRGEAAMLDTAAPWLENKTFARAEVLHVKSRDGLPIEAYLTLPPGQGRHPLIVHPHGGPVDVRDDRLFDPEVQFLASLGYAVLQVNYRGSDGYGKAFRDAGRKQWGTGIEDDLDAALQDVLAHYPVDAQRMCVVGASYGGYSALESALRWPDRFRCVVSMAGVSDRVLFFTASDFSQGAKSRANAERIIGDPNKELEQMLTTSPLYHYRDVKTPVMLVHGREDTRVDYEHARRLVRMLNIAGHKPVMLSFDNEGHGLDAMDDIEAAYSGIAGFLQQYLGGAPSTVAATPASSSPATSTPAAPSGTQH
jgi:dipeptidyl aminopeptidase/acylaminoacyl peptidase